MPANRPSSTRLEKRDAAIAARLFAEEELEPRQIAAIFDVAPSSVSRWLDAAKESGALTVIRRFDASRLTEEVRSETEAWFRERRQRADGDAEGDLQKLLAGFGVERLIVTRSSLPATESFRDRIEEFARQVAGPLLDQISQCRRVGVAWGETVGQSLLATAERVDTPPKKRHIQFVPLAGESPQYNAYSATAVAAKLHHKFNPGSHSAPLSLAGVPAFIPSGTTREVALQFVKRAVDDYARIFEGPECLAATCDLIVTSAGRLEQNVLKRLCKDVSTSEEALLRSNILGDMCGILFPKPNATASGQKFLRKLEEGWTGLNRSHVFDAAGKPRRVISLLAIDRNKCEIVAALIRAGLVRSLYCDESLAEALRDEFSRRGARGETP